jgi:regulator of protease activity HflC (stomatin/prohibitin superfamily)
MPEEQQTETLPTEYAQLTQVRVPLEDAGGVFAGRDASGRTPLILIPLNPHRIRNAFVIGGLVALGAGLVSGILLYNLALASLASTLGVVLIVFGIYRSFLLRVPEGTTALLMRGGKHIRTLDAGFHIVPSWFAVSHLVTRREIPYDVPAVEAFSADDVRVTVDTLITFGITDPYRFVYRITADDFDDVLQAACQHAIRGQVRRLSAGEILDVNRLEAKELRKALSAEVEPYGVEVMRVNVTETRLPDEFLRSYEARQLAVSQHVEQSKKQTLAQRRQADAEALERQQVIARVEREREALQAQVQHAEIRQRVAQLDAETEELRLSKLEDRLRKYPLAAQYEIQHAQLEIARALAGNTRAVVQVGQADDILRSFVIREFLQDSLALPTTSLEESQDGEQLAGTATEAD